MSRAVVNPGGNVVDFASLIPRATGVSTRDSKLTPQQRYRQEGVALGYDQGYNDGVSKGRQDGMRMGLEEVQRSEQAALNHFLATLNGQAMRASAAVDEFAYSLEGPLASLAVVIAARIIGREIQLDPDVIVEMTRKAIAEAAFAKNARLKINPFDEEALRKHEDVILTIAPTMKTVDIIADPNVLAGCVVETDLGVVDAKVETMLNNALAAIREAA
ncbi:MAG: FliH/SctL family protein [Fimbriimonadaceae bacterium]